MKKILILQIVLIVLTIFTTQAQTFSCIYGDSANPNLACLKVRQYSFNEESEAIEAVKNILQPIGLAPNFVLVPCANINNCAALILEDGFRYIVYDKAFMEIIANDSRSNWAYTSILAHEIGHHLQGHTTRSVDLVSMRKMELEADKFSGFILAKLGATLVEAQAAMQVLPHPNDENASNHPAMWRRLAAIKEGYDEAALNLSPTNTEVSHSPVTELERHEIISSQDFPNLKPSYDRGYIFRDAVHIDNKWIVFMVKSTTAQICIDNYYNNFPHQQLRENLASKYIDFFYNQGNKYQVVMTQQQDNYYAQEYTFHSTIERNFIYDLTQLKAKSGKILKGIYKSNYEYLFIWDQIQSFVGNGSGVSQSIYSGNDFPLTNILKNSKDGLSITFQKYVDKKWIVIMSNPNTASFRRLETITQMPVVSKTGTQSCFSSYTFPVDMVIKLDHEGYVLEAVDYDGINWRVVMNKFYY